MGDRSLSPHDVELRNVSDCTGPQTMGRGNSDGLRQRSPPPQVELSSMSYHGPPAGIDPLSREERPWCLAIYGGSAIDLLLSLLVFIEAAKYAYRDMGVSLACLATQVTSHWISSILLIFRFHQTVVTSSLLPAEDDSMAEGLIAQRRRDLGREQGLGVSMGLLMVCSSGMLIFKGAQKIKFWDKWYADHSAMDAENQAVSEWLAWWGFGVYVFAAILRYLAWKKLRVRLLYHAFWCSVVSLIFLFILGLAASYQTPTFWKAEPLAAFVLAGLCLFEGMRVVLANMDNIDMVLRDNTRP
eukprot:gnl/MRDRNA2_/MRDRNA2_76074_c0_seq1.p1 gnl/MRDRNA2_/MRDRNA2_76074_c0~~gnl/MRDRNA2_/MRDRNA2_76074_c0_seq1.p1  ORF type:complete len:299 (-),score=38.82 gnl/MRDRNA2_/MRDRNA2_76074_c0_seq1:200-1096(-)